MSNAAKMNSGTNSRLPNLIQISSGIQTFLGVNTGTDTETA
jgi:hypothetical protein